MFAVDIDDLDVLSGLYRVSAGGGIFYQQILHRLEAVKLPLRVGTACWPLVGFHSALRERPVFSHACHSCSNSMMVARQKAGRRGACRLGV